MRELIKTRPSFFLRWDFAFESGFVDHLRREVSQEEFASICQKAGEQASSLKSIEAFNAQRSQTPAPRYILAGGAIRPGATTPIPLLFDGTTVMLLDSKCGLFADILARVALVAPPRKGEASRILHKPLEASQKTWARPEFAVVHDAMTSTAEVWSWPEAWEALKAWAANP